MKEDQEETEATEATPQVVASVIYIGPNVAKLGLQSFQVFKGGTPERLGSEPVVARLFVPLEDFRRARAALNVEGSPEWSAYRDAVRAFNKRGVQ
jgi:hypothetical protein